MTQCVMVRSLKPASFLRPSLNDLSPSLPRVAKHPLSPFVPVAEKLCRQPSLHTDTRSCLGKGATGWQSRLARAE